MSRDYQGSNYRGMEILSSNGSEYIIRSKDGRIWLTKRVKAKSSRARKTKLYSKRYIPIAELPDESRRVYLEIIRKKTVTLVE